MGLGPTNPPAAAHAHTHGEGCCVFITAGVHTKRRCSAGASPQGEEPLRQPPELLYLLPSIPATRTVGGEAAWGWDTRASIHYSSRDDLRWHSRCSRLVSRGSWSVHNRCRCGRRLGSCLSQGPHGSSIIVTTVIQPIAIGLTAPETLSAMFSWQAMPSAVLPGGWQTSPCLCERLHARPQRTIHTTQGQCSGDSGDAQS